MSCTVGQQSRTERWKILHRFGTYKQYINEGLSMYLVGLKLWSYPLLQVVFRTVDDTRVSIFILGSKHELSDVSPE